MKKLLLSTVVFLPSLAWSVMIPVKGYDQSKLEMYLRRMPNALVKSEKLEGFVRNHYQFPETPKNFSFKCTSDFYNSSPVPSAETCEVELLNVKPTYEEYEIKLTDPAVTKPLYDALSYSNTVKRTYAFDRVYGQSLNGKYRDLFRYMIICETPEACLMTFTAKPSVED